MATRLVFNYVSDPTRRVYIVPLITPFHEDNPNPAYGVPPGNGYEADGLTDEEWEQLDYLLDKVHRVRDVPFSEEQE